MLAQHVKVDVLRAAVGDTRHGAAVRQLSDLARDLDRLLMVRLGVELRDVEVLLSKEDAGGVEAERLPEVGAGGVSSMSPAT